MEKSPAAPAHTSTPPTAEEAATRLRILKAAKANLRRFGAGKTTVVDIARDLGMSHSNVYRFFRTKAEILDAVVEEWLADEDLLLAELAARPGTAGARIEGLLLALLARKLAKRDDDAELAELYHRILAERPAAMARHTAAVLAAFERIIAAGVRDGEFAPLDTAVTARVLGHATSLFFTPEFLRLAAIPDGPHKAWARDVIRTVVAGFGNRESPPILQDAEPGP
jgi:AcrR family transcriptional regulator